MASLHLVVFCGSASGLSPGSPVRQAGGGDGCCEDSRLVGLNGSPRPPILRNEGFCLLLPCRAGELSRLKTVSGDTLPDEVGGFRALWVRGLCRGRTCLRELSSLLLMMPQTGPL